MNTPILLFAESYMGCDIRYFWDEQLEKFCVDVRGRHTARGPLIGPFHFEHDFVRVRLSFLARLGIMLNIVTRWKPVTKAVKRRSA